MAASSEIRGNIMLLALFRERNSMCNTLRTRIVSQKVFLGNVISESLGEAGLSGVIFTCVHISVV